MSTLVVQERHLWLNLADMCEPDKVRFLNSPVCQAGLFGDVVENFAQQFSAAQKQTEAIEHILPQQPAAAFTQTSVAVPPSARRRGCPPVAASVPAQPKQQPPPRRQLPAARGMPSPSRPPPNQAASIRVSGPETGDPEMGASALQEMAAAPLPPPRRAGWRIFCFLLFLFRRGLLGVQRYPHFQKRAISSISGSQESAGCSV